MAEFRQYSTKNKVTTKANFDSLDKSTLSIGEQYSIVGPLEKDDLSTDIQNSLTKADNAFVAPTNDSTATDGQVLTKTAGGSEWKDAVSGDVTAAGNNTFTGTNTFNGTLTAKSGATVPGSGMGKTVYKHHQIAITNPSLGTATYNFGITSGFIGTVATKEHDCFTYIEKTAGPVSSAVVLSFTVDESTQIYNNFEKTILKVSVSDSGAQPVIHLYPYGFNATSGTEKYCIFVSQVYNEYQYVLTMSITSGQTSNGSLSKVAVGGSGGAFNGGIVSGSTGFSENLYVGTVSLNADGTTVIPDPAFVKIGKDATIQLTNASGKTMTWSYIGFQKTDSNTGYDYGLKIPNKTPASNNQTFTLATLDDIKITEATLDGTTLSLTLG